MHNQGGSLHGVGTGNDKENHCVGTEMPLLSPSPLICSKSVTSVPSVTAPSVPRALVADGCAIEQVQPCPGAFGQQSSLKEDQQIIFALKMLAKLCEQPAFG